MNKYKVRSSEGLKFSIEADYINRDNNVVIFYRTLTDKSDELVALFINPASVIREAE